ncbi:hypothetical protein DFJ74DRAFT_703311 [Hyaloraphidium curvatum]|nr:hypothetical protein DFJ74DRAFT_703311 [Hyaloraphidium curvatum]
MPSARELIVIDRENCVGCGCCAGEAAEVYYLDDQGKAAVHDVELDPSDQEQPLVRAAIWGRDGCPSECIMLQW